MTAPTDIEAGTGYQPDAAVLDAEIAIASGCLLGSSTVDTASEMITEADFYSPELGAVFNAARELSGEGKPVDLISVQHHLAANGMPPKLREPGALASLVGRNMTTHPESIRYHARIVADDALRRRIWIEATRARSFASTPDFEPEHVDRIIANIQAAAEGRAGREQKPLWVDDDMSQYVAGLDEPLGANVIPSPWSDLNDRVTMSTGELVVVGARPGGGKSIVGLQTAVHTAVVRRECALVSSMEMSRNQLFDRMFAAEADVELSHITKHQLTWSDRQRITEAAKRITNSPLVIDDTTKVTLPHLRARIRWMNRRAPVRLVVVDYLQLMQATARHESRVLEVGEFSRGLKLMAKDLDVCVVALAQLNRLTDMRADKRPQMSDLRESGSIENDADTVMFSHPQPVREDGKPRTGEVDIVVRKQRNGISDVDIPLAWQPHKARIMLLG